MPNAQLEGFGHARIGLGGGTESKLRYGSSRAQRQAAIDCERHDEVRGGKGGAELTRLGLSSDGHRRAGSTGTDIPRPSTLEYPGLGDAWPISVML